MAETRSGVAGTLDQALQRARALLERSPPLAERQAREILLAVPGEPRARLILAIALRRQSRVDDALVVLEPLAAEQPNSAQTQFEIGDVLASVGRRAEAAAALQRATTLKPDFAAAWRALGDALGALGESEAADRAFAQMIRASVTDAALMRAADALAEDRLAEAEHLLRERLRSHPADVAAMRMLAEAGLRLGRYGDVEALLDRCLEIAPSFDAARFAQATALFRQQKGAAALGHLERLLASEPANPRYRNLMASCLGLIGEYDRAIGIYRALLSDFPPTPETWLNLGHALRTSGRAGEAVEAYRAALRLSPGLGDAWWSLANLKTVPFDDEDLAQMCEQLELEDLRDVDRLHLHYALGKALEDRASFADSFAHYEAGAALRRAASPYDATAAHDEMLRAKALFTAPFFAAREGWGLQTREVIFVVGLPRSGSTLIEQILASHSAVEGTIELPDVGEIARELGWAGRKGNAAPYPEILAELPRDMFVRLGADYLERAAAHRKLGRPVFIDKMPGNFHHLGFIRLMLPQARIIDARRRPMAAGFSAFKQHFARGHAFSYDLEDIGAYYRDYVELMAHFDDVQPGAILRVRYEELVGDTETQVRRMLDYCGLPFEPGCLKFYENDRAVRTASSEQVRRPIFRDAVDHWRAYEPWLEPLKIALGPALAEEAGGEQIQR